MEIDKILVDSLVNAVKKSLDDEFSIQGHHMDGSGIENIQAEVTMNDSEFVIEFYGAAYLAILNQGVAPENVPYSGNQVKSPQVSKVRVRSGSGNTSLYIEALKRWAGQRMHLGEKEALSMAFAIAKTQKKEGMPTQGSYAYSNDGNRTNFIDIALEASNDDIDTAVSEMFDEIVNVEIDNMLNFLNDGNNS